MKKVTFLLAGMILLAAVLCFSTKPAQAVPPFKKEFDGMYMKEGSAMFTALNGKSNCNVCHQGKKSKKNRNDYGMAISKIIKKTEKDPAKIQAALETVAKQKSGGEDSPTFGELIETGKLPITTEEP